MLLGIQTKSLRHTTTYTRCETHEVLSGILGLSQTVKIFYSENLVSMTNSRQTDDTLNGCRAVLPLLITNEVGFLVTDVSYTNAHDMITSDRHDWIPPKNDRGYGIPPVVRTVPKPIMTTDYVLKRSHTNTSPGLLLRVLKTVNDTVDIVSVVVTGWTYCAYRLQCTHSTPWSQLRTDERHRCSAVSPADPTDVEGHQLDRLRRNHVRQSCLFHGVQEHGG
jgi:hypothetical protein